MLEAAVVNPHDGEAQYQIGLIQQSRRRYTEAIARFSAAVAIDPGETDAHFQLGRIAFSRSGSPARWAISKPCWRRMRSTARVKSAASWAHLSGAGAPRGCAARVWPFYVERRPYDPQGLYYYGRALEEAGQPSDRARGVRAGRGSLPAPAPRYRRRVVAEWSRLAQRQSRRMVA